MHPADDNVPKANWLFAKPCPHSDVSSHHTSQGAHMHFTLIMVADYISVSPLCSIEVDKSMPLINRQGFSLLLAGYQIMLTSGKKAGSSLVSS